MIALGVQADADNAKGISMFAIMPTGFFVIIDVCL